METTLLATKLFIPPVRQALASRPRLLERLNAILNSSLTLVSAPAGFGKTTLLTQWIQKEAAPTAWLSLDEAESDPPKFWEYVIAALRTILPEVGEASMSLLQSSERSPTEYALTLLINDLSRVSHDCVLVLDDYYRVQSEEVQKGVTLLVERMPPKMHLIIATRADPPLPLARLMGKGVLFEIRANDLRFTHEEAGDLLSCLGAPVLSDTELTALNAKAEGWAVGLKMASVLMKRRDGISDFVSSFAGTQRYIMDYLIEEVLQRQSPDLRDFLLKTSVLRRFSGPLCDAVAGGSGGKEMLSSIERANLFLVPLDDSGEWYRYHHLFRDLLQHRLNTERGDKARDDLHLRASRWYEENGLLEDAIHHALQARDWARSMDLISIPAVNLANQLSLALFNWLRQIPEELLRTRLGLYMNYVWAALSTGHNDILERCLGFLDTVAGTSPHLQGRIANVRSQLYAQKGDFKRTEEWAKRALSTLSVPAPDSWFPDSTVDRGLAAGMLGALYLNQFRFADAEPLLREQLECSRVAASRGSAQVFPLIWLGLIAFLRGRPQEAVRSYQEAIDLAERGEGAASHVCLAHLYISQVYYEWNEMEKAALHGDLAVDLFRPSKIAGSMQLDQAYLQVARTRAAMGEAKQAERALERADRLLSESDGNHEMRVRNAAHHAFVALLDGDSEAANGWIDILADLGPPVSLDTPTPVIGLLRQRAGRDAADKQLRADYELLASRGIQRGMVGARILQALNCAESDDALMFLKDALRAARGQGYVRTFVDFGMSLAPLLSVVVKEDIDLAYARKMLDTIRAEQRRRRARTGEVRPSTPTGELLSQREMEVLRLIAAGLSNQDIAKSLVVSLSTAKTHVHRLFAKLEAKDRLQAVTRARRLKLL